MTAIAPLDESQVHQRGRSPVIAALVGYFNSDRGWEGRDGLILHAHNAGADLEDRRTVIVEMENSIPRRLNSIAIEGFAKRGRSWQIM
ncbi:hypothetical protein X777_06896 [Ooceraea biroi]|uniref:Uncharacterized protein n=1 Tax=Ooceraea biroi TaxID=2015173 RepID=A0A026WC46_OOCBI|nr:hypothetical protein X777_06896 [Ooceraea biroi]